MIDKGHTRPQIDPIWGERTVESIDDALYILLFDYVPDARKYVHMRCQELLYFERSGLESVAIENIYRNLRKARDVLYQLLPKTKKPPTYLFKQNRKARRKKRDGSA